VSYTKEKYTDSAGEHRWRLTHHNGQIVGASSEGFSSADECAKNAWRVAFGLIATLGLSDSLDQQMLEDLDDVLLEWLETNEEGDDEASQARYERIESLRNYLNEAFPPAPVALLPAGERA
jgi:uncharacterized protein YegP (UPF0339 family)